MGKKEVCPNVNTQFTGVYRLVCISSPIRVFVILTLILPPSSMSMCVHPTLTNEGNTLLETLVRIPIMSFLKTHVIKGTLVILISYCSHYTSFMLWFYCWNQIIIFNIGLMRRHAQMPN